MHPFSGEFALADGVAGTSGSVWAHMTIDAFGTPWTFLTYQRSHHQIFLFYTIARSSYPSKSPCTGYSWRWSGCFRSHLRSTHNRARIDILIQICNLRDRTMCREVECLETRIQNRMPAGQSAKGFKSVIGQMGSFRHRQNQLTLPNGLQCTEAQPDRSIVSFISMANDKDSINSTIFGLILRGGHP